MLYGIIEPILFYYGFQIVTSNLQFAFLVLTCLFLSAAGYVINDYFDRKADHINRPNKVVVGVKIQRRSAIILHSVFNFIALVLGFALAISIGKFWFGFVFVLISLLFWWYSARLKKLAIAGNILIALLSGILPIIILAFLHYGSIYIQGPHSMGFAFALKQIFKVLMGFAVFAFLFTLIREIVKDIEDVKGDIAMYCKTLPIVAGIKLSRQIVAYLCFISFALILVAYFIFIRNFEFVANDFLSLWYIIGLVAFPVLYCGIKVLFSVKKQDFSKISKMLKYNMLTGILYAIILRIIIISNIL